MCDSCDITPALSGIADGVPPEIIKHRWNSFILVVLNVEDGVYDAAFRSYAIARDGGRNKADGFRIFLELLRWLGHDTAEMNQVIYRAVFDAYWEMATRTEYWPTEKKCYGTQIAYTEAKELWHASNSHVISERKERLSRWLSEL